VLLHLVQQIVAALGEMVDLLHVAHLGGLAGKLAAGLLNLSIYANVSTVPKPP